MNFLIGISGKAGHGKDSLAGFLREMFLDHSEDIIHTVCFADKLKKITADILDVNYYYVHDQAGKLEEIEHMGGITGRKADQIIGTDIARAIYPNVWVYHYDLSVRDFFFTAGSEDNYIIFTPDVRFQNEYDYIKNLNCYTDIEPILIRVVRPEFHIIHGSEHASETGLDHINQWDYRVAACDLEQLKEQAKEVFRMITER